MYMVFVKLQSYINIMKLCGCVLQLNALLCSRECCQRLV